MTSTVSKVVTREVLKWKNCKNKLRIKVQEIKAHKIHIPSRVQPKHLAKKYFTFIRRYRKILDMVYEAVPHVVVGVTEVLPRKWNWYSGHQGNFHLPFTMDHIGRLNKLLHATASEYRNCWFVRYSAVFNTEEHLGRDGLHVNRTGAIVLKKVLESAAEEFIGEITEPLSVSTEAVEVAPVISNAKVAKLGPPTDNTVQSLTFVYEID